MYVVYLNLSENPALFTALNADTMDVYDESVAFEPDKAQELSDRAMQVLRACKGGKLLPRSSVDEDAFACRFCGYRARCWHA